MIRRDYRKADVRFISQTYDTATKTVALRYHATAGPIVASRSTACRQRRSPRTPVLAQPGVQRRRHRQRRRRDRQVVPGARLLQRDRRHRRESSKETSGSSTFKVDPGQQFKLAAVTFTGKSEDLGERTAGLVQTSPTRRLKLVPRDDLPPTDRRHARAAERRPRRHRVVLPASRLLRGDRRDAGRQHRTPRRHDDRRLPDHRGAADDRERRCTIEGNEQVPTRDLPKLHAASRASRSNPQLVRERPPRAADLLRRSRQRRGADHAAARTCRRTRRRRTSRTSSPKGRRSKSATSSCAATPTRRSNVILRKAGIDTGDPFCYIAILEAQRNLYRLGIFQRVDIQAEQAGTGVSDRNVVISGRRREGPHAQRLLGASKESGQQGLAAHLGVGRAPQSLRHRPLPRPSSTSRAARTKRRVPDVSGAVHRPLQRSGPVHDLPQQGRSDPMRRIDQRGASIEDHEDRAAADPLVDPLRVPDRQLQVRRLSATRRRSTSCRASTRRSPTSTSPLTPTFFWDRRDDPIDPHHGFFTTALARIRLPDAPRRRATSSSSSRRRRTTCR